MKIILVFVSTLKAAEPTFIQRYETLLSKGYEWRNVSQTIGNNWVRKFEDPNFSARFFVEFAEDMRTIFDETSGKNLRLFRIINIIYINIFRSLFGWCFRNGTYILPIFTFQWLRD